MAVTSSCEYLKGIFHIGTKNACELSLILTFSVIKSNSKINVFTIFVEKAKNCERDFHSHKKPAIL
jgi:hypothetical protein